MDYHTASLLCAGLMLFLLMIGVPIAYALGLSSVIIGYMAFGSFALQKAGWTTFQLLYNLTWTPLPLFTLMSFFRKNDYYFENKLHTFCKKSLTSIYIIIIYY